MVVQRLNKPAGRNSLPFADSAAHRAIFDLSGKSAVVTGAGSGFGRTFSLTLAAFGAMVFCIDRDIEAASSTVAMIANSGGRSSAHCVDVQQDISVREFANELLEAETSLDILINNAGVTAAPARVHETDDESWDMVIDVSLNGAFRCARALLPLMMARGGSIINISSIMGLTGFYPGFPAISASYNSAKAALDGLTRQIAAEYAANNIRCNAIAPGWHQGTNLGVSRRAASSTETVRAFDQAVVSGIPMKRKGSPEDLRGLIVLLASDASAYITGQVFVQDGGWTAV